MKLPIFVTRVNVGQGRGTVLISMDSPAGDVSKGQVENLETVRVAMSMTTFVEMTQLFVDIVKKSDASRRASATQAGWTPGGESADIGTAFPIAASTQKH